MLPLFILTISLLIWLALVDFLAERNAKEPESLTVTFLYFLDKRRKERKQVEAILRKQSHKTQPCKLNIT